MRITQLIPPVADRAASGKPERIEQWARLGLAVPPSWTLSLEQDELDAGSDEPARDPVRDPVRDKVEAIAEQLAALPGRGESNYWILRQGPAQAGSLRDQLVNLDSDAALAAAVYQILEKNPQTTLTVHAIPSQQAVGVLFSRHPLRPDLDHVIVEGVQGTESEQQRVVFRANGEVGYRSTETMCFVDAVGAEPFIALADTLKQHVEGPQACEWVWDGHQLWVLQILPIGSLPHPKEVWSSVTGFGIWNQAVSPLWYTMQGRWLKTVFWRELGERAGWSDLGNVEPYRRLHSHIYTNSEFVRRLQSVAGSLPRLAQAVPPAWRPADAAASAQALAGKSLERFARKVSPISFYTGALKRIRVEGKLSHYSRRAAEGVFNRHTAWLELMQLDQLGERIAFEEAYDVLLRLPAWDAAAFGDMAVAPLHWLENGALADVLQRLGDAEEQRLSSGLNAALDRLVASVAGWSAGADPVMARFSERNGDVRRLLAEIVESLPESRKQALQTLPDHPPAPGVIKQWQAMAGARRKLGSLLRQHLLDMAQTMVADGKLGQPDDVFFLYFDELWQLWHGKQTPPGSEPRQILKRKMRYLSDSRRSVPDWVIDQIAYGVGHEGEAQPVMAGECLVPGQVQGVARVVRSFWNLDDVSAGDVLVVDECDLGWLPWMLGAAAFVIARKDVFHPAACLASAVGIPAVWAVDDAANCLQDGTPVTIDAEAGRITLG